MDLILASHVKNEYWHNLINNNLSKMINYFDNVYIVYSVSDNINSTLFEKNIMECKGRCRRGKFGRSKPRYNNVNIKFIKVDNVGYDFRKYKIGMLSMNVISNPDWNAYLNRYSDLQEKFGSDTAAAKKHWHDCGKAEGRICQLDTNKSVVLMNDSFILCRDINDIMESIQEKINKDVQFIGLSRACHPRVHYQSYFWVLNYNLVPILCDHLTECRLDTRNGSNNIIQKCEVDLSHLFIDRYKTDFIYDTNFDNMIVDRLVNLLEIGYPVIKMQCLKKVRYHNAYTDKDGVRTLLRSFEDFNPTVYKELHNDLKHLSDVEATEHFFTNGIGDQERKYKYDQKTYIPTSIKLIIKHIGLQLEKLLGAPPSVGNGSRRVESPIKKNLMLCGPFH